MSNQVKIVRDGILSNVKCIELVKFTRHAELFVLFQATHEISKLTYMFKNEDKRILVRVTDTRYNTKEKNLEAMQFIVEFINSKL